MKKNTYIIGSAFFLLLTFSLTYCTVKKPTQGEIVIKNAEQFLKSRMDDPDSYEFVELKLYDSVLYIDNTEYQKEYFQRDIDFNKQRIESSKQLIESNKQVLESFKNLNVETTSIEKQISEEYEQIKEKENEIAKDEKIITSIDSIKTVLGVRLNDVASFTYIFRFRANNKVGAKILNEYILQIGSAPEYKVINLTYDKNKVILNPNLFPGYDEIIEKHK